MERNAQTRVTRKMKAVDSNLVQDTCAEPSCGMAILVEKEDKAAGRKSRCVACLMRAKLLRGESL